MQLLVLKHLRTLAMFIMLIIFNHQVLAQPSSTSAENQKIPVASAKQLTAQDYKPGIIKHIVLFKYKPSVSTETKNVVANRFISLQKQATRNDYSYIISVEAGYQLSQELMGQGFEQGFIVTFASEGDRNYYVGEPFITEPAFYDPTHHKFKAFVSPYLDQAQCCLVFDFRPIE
jgi:hypothetical protein